MHNEPQTLWIRITVTTILTALLLLAYVETSQAEQIDLSPANWDKDIFESYFGQDEGLKYGDGMRARHKLAVGEKGMIVGTTGAAAVHAGLEALQQGGSAVDAAMTTALTQICFAGGAWVSYAGFMQMMYYDSASGEIYNMNAAFGTVKGEDDPMSIPTGDPLVATKPLPDGRTALVPGFFAGVEAAHKRFGKLPLEALFQPAIYFAENGFPVGDILAAMTAGKQEVLSRLPETKAVFTKKNGEFYKKGDLFKQPKLSATLRRVADEGARAYFYEGEWAEKFVAAVQRDGGKITMDDMRDYHVMWQAPASTTYGDYEVHTVGLPSYGGIHVLQALNLVELTGVNEYGHYSKSPEALFWLIQSCTAFRTRSFWAMETKEVPGINLALNVRHKRTTAEVLWKAAQEGKIPDALLTQGIPSDHSEGIVVVDRWGNVVAMTHTINTGAWGNTGINVGGISIPDAAKFQQAQIQNAGPGARLPDPTAPLIVTQAGRPVVAIGSIGSGLHYKTVCVLTSLLNFNMNPKEAVDIESLMDNFADGTEVQSVGKDEFDPTLIEAVEAMGQKFTVLDEGTMPGVRGYVVVISLDPKTGALEGAGPGEFLGGAEGY